MLSAWFRFKYPNSVDGALAASAPIYIVANLTSPYAFFGLVTQVGNREYYVGIPVIAMKGLELCTA